MCPITCPNCDETSYIDEHVNKCPTCQYEFFKVEYQRPELTAEDKVAAEKDCKKLITKYGYNNLPKILAALAVENIRLVKEVNEHRAARGIDPMPVFEV